MIDARITRLREDLAARPGSAAALSALGTALWWAGRHDEGLSLLEQAVQADPLHPESLAALGNALAALDRPEAAEPLYRAVLAVRPDDAAVLNNLGSALRRQDRLAEALDYYRRAVALRPELAGVHGNFGSALLALGRAEEALAPLRTAARLAPDDAEACNNLGGVLLALDQAPEAEGWFGRAVTLDPLHRQARFGLAMALLTQGKFLQGWEEYDVRWLDPAFIADEPAFTQPAWRGAEEVTGRTVLLHAEQGLGDTLQFVRYAPLLRARGARVVLQVQAPLTALLGDLADVVIVRGAEPPPFDLRCPLLSLPRAFSTELASIPARVPYLRAPLAHLQRWSARLGEQRRRRIGIAVSGDAGHPEDGQRSIPAAAFLAAFAGIDAELHVLQKHLRPADAPALAGLSVHDPWIEDFRDTAALTLLMDLVVTVDTAPAHLAGGLGVPVWVLLQHGADFRWLRDRADSPWYPTARLFRQPRPGDWGSVLAAVNAALRAG